MLQRVTLKFLLMVSILAGLTLVLFANAALAQDFKTYRITQKGTFQVGEEWNRTFYDDRLTSIESLNNLIKASARVELPNNEHGTAFYLGKFAGVHLMLTNYHVVADSRVCLKSKVYFEYHNKKFSCSKVLAAFKDLEATFISIRVNPKDEYIFENLALQFDLSEFRPGHKLVTAGYGIHKNGRGMLSHESSQTCVVATSNKNTKLLELTTEKKTSAAHSFVHSCEISPGDSGSAIVSETTGKVVGLTWATSYKPKQALNTLNVFNWIDSQSPLLWETMSYAVPPRLIMAAISATDNLALNEFYSSNFIGQ